LSSITNPYNPLERKYQLIRKALELLTKHKFPVSIVIKSALVVRDVDVLRKSRALELLYKEEIRNYAFVGPVPPYLTDVGAIINRLEGINKREGFGF